MEDRKFNTDSRLWKLKGHIYAPVYIILYGTQITALKANPPTVRMYFPTDLKINIIFVTLFHFIDKVLIILFLHIKFRI